MSKLNITDFLGMEYPVSLYMIATGKTTVSLEEINNYSGFLNRKFQDNNDNLRFLCTLYYLQEMAYRFSDLFEVNCNEVRYIGKNMSGIDKFKDLRTRVVAYLSIDELTPCLQYTEEYAKKNNLTLDAKFAEKSKTKPEVKEDGKKL